jgi:hypothetical protein
MALAPGLMTGTMIKRLFSYEQHVPRETGEHCQVSSAKQQATGSCRRLLDESFVEDITTVLLDTLPSEKRF